MKNTIVAIVAFIFGVALITGCSSKKQLLDTNISCGIIDKIQVVTAMGNPAYGADSKIITNENEIKLFVDTFNGATTGKKIEIIDTNLAMPSFYYFYSNNTLVAQFAFNGNDTNKIWLKDNFYSIDYAEDKKTPFELYIDSKADIFVVDENGTEMKRPQE